MIKNIFNFRGNDGIEMAELAQEELKESRDKLDEIDNLLMLEIMPR